MRPAYPEVYDNLLLSYHYYDGLSASSMLDAHLEWDRRFGARAPLARDAFVRRRGRQRLRIGFASFDLTRQAFKAFLSPVIAALDRSRFVAIGVNAAYVAKDHARRLDAPFDEWHHIHVESDQQLVSFMRSLDLDILVDLDGHVPGNRLRVWSHRVAPVQVTWLDYFDTTGSKAIDYLAGDSTSNPLAGSQLFSEVQVRVDPCRLVYMPPIYAPDLAPPPALAKERITFGSFNRLSKLTDPLLDDWSDLLRRVPNSVLVLKSSAFECRNTRDAVGRRFVARGIDAGRLSLRGRSEHREMLMEYNEIDIALDTHPYNGGVTTAEVLYMGLPIVGRLGTSMISSQTAAMLVAANLEHWIVHDRMEWIRLNIALASDTALLSEWRRTSREHLQASKLLDHEAFTRKFAHALHEMYRKLAA